jgi:hypothetical protein
MQFVQEMYKYKMIVTNFIRDPDELERVYKLLNGGESNG